jgi:superfamily II DNA or RNA helicase
MSNVREQTRREAETILLEKSSCAILRPTGFGKTYMMSRMMDKFGPSLFVYPRTVIKDAIKAREVTKILNSRVTFLSYHMLSLHGISLLKRTVRDNNIRLVVFDELQCLGADKIWDEVEDLKNWLKDRGVKILGGTATPVRSDGRDIVERVFDDNIVFPYNLHDSIQDKILPQFYYFCGAYRQEVVAGRAKQILTNNQKGLPEAYKKINPEDLRSIELASYTLCDMESTFRDGFRQAYGEIPSYIKMLVFMPGKDTFVRDGATADSYKAIANTEEIIQWFKNAFKDKTVNSVYVTSDEDDKEGLDKLYKLKKQNNHIDLIFSIDMLNLGYHVPDITGEVMVRGTESQQVYPQQIGRPFYPIIPGKYEHKPIIFDLVGNIDRHVYLFEKDEVANKEKKITKARQAANNLYKVTREDCHFSPRALAMQDAMKRLTDAYGAKFEAKFLEVYNAKGLYAKTVKILCAIMNCTPTVVLKMAEKYGLKLEPDKKKNEPKPIEQQ